MYIYIYIYILYIYITIYLKYVNTRVVHFVFCMNSSQSSCNWNHSSYTNANLINIREGDQIFSVFTHAEVCPTEVVCLIFFLCLPVSSTAPNATSRV